MDTPGRGIAGVGGVGVAVVAGRRQVNTFPHGAGVVGAGIGVDTLCVGLTWGLTALIDLAVAVVVDQFGQAVLQFIGIYRGVSVVAVTLVGGESITVRIGILPVEVATPVSTGAIGSVIPITVGVADIAEAVSILIGLVGVGDERAVVRSIAISSGAEAISIRVRASIARIPEFIGVGVGLIKVGHGRAVVVGVRDGISVHVGVTQIAREICVEVGLIGVRDGRTVVGGIEIAVAVHVRVADVSQGISIDVGLVGVGDERAVVGRVENAIIIIVIIAGVAHGITIGIGLVQIRNQRAVVGRVENVIIIIVVVADVAEFIPVQIFLERIRDGRAIVVGVFDAITISVFFAGVADAVVVRIDLVVRHERAVVIDIEEAVIVIVIVAGIAHSITIGVGLIRVRNDGAVVHEIGTVRLGISRPCHTVHDAIVVSVHVAHIAEAVQVEVRLEDAFARDTADPDFGRAVAIRGNRPRSPVGQLGRVGRMGTVGREFAGNSELDPRHVTPPRTVVELIRDEISILIRQSELPGLTRGFLDLYGAVHRAGAENATETEHDCYYQQIDFAHGFPPQLRNFVPPHHRGEAASKTILIYRPIEKQSTSRCI